MEEYVGKIWHNYIAKRADISYPESVAKLINQRKTVEVLFHALGGEKVVSIDSSAELRVKKVRSFLQKIAGTGNSVSLALQDSYHFQLPEVIAEYEDPSLNKSLYFWLSCLATTPLDSILSPYIRVREILKIYPNLLNTYLRLVDGHIKVRDLYTFKGQAQEVESRLRVVLLNPLDDHDFDINDLPKYRLPAVSLWIYLKPDRVNTTAREKDNDDEVNRDNKSSTKELKQKKSADYAEPKQERGGLLLFRLESLFSWSEFLNVDRPEDDEDDEDVVKIAEDLDEITLNCKNSKASKGIKLDLDLPSDEQDFEPLESGILLPEWDYKKQLLVENSCSLTVLENTAAVPIDLPSRLYQSSKRIQKQFERIKTNRQKLYRQADGHEINLLSHLQFVTDQAVGHVAGDPMLYNDTRIMNRNLSCLLLADFSLSTDASIKNGDKVIDLIRDSLFLFANSLSLMQDRFAIYGFSSKYRENIRYHKIKAFDESFSPIIFGRINEIKPDYYTRMGAAIRHSTSILQKEKTDQKLLLILTDGKPNDLDKYESRYGVEDTRQAVLEAKRAGLIPFCITIDDTAQKYLSHIFGQSHWIHVKDKSSLPKQLPQLYVTLTERI